MKSSHYVHSKSQTPWLLAHFFFSIPVLSLTKSWHHRSQIPSQLQIWTCPCLPRSKQHWIIFKLQQPTGCDFNVWKLPSWEVHAMQGPFFPLENSQNWFTFWWYSPSSLAICRCDAHLLPVHHLVPHQVPEAACLQVKAVRWKCSPTSPTIFDDTHTKHLAKTCLHQSSWWSACQWALLECQQWGLSMWS